VGDRFFIVREGLVRCTVNERMARSGRHMQREVAHCGVGDYFGELALLGGGEGPAGGEDEDLGCRRRANAIAMENPAAGGADREPSPAKGGGGQPAANAGGAGGTLQGRGGAVCLSLSRADFEAHLGPLRAVLDMNVCAAALAEVPLLQGLSELKLKRLASGMVSRWFEQVG
jgi:hypothetical protein